MYTHPKNYKTLNSVCKCIFLQKIRTGQNVQPRKKCYFPGILKKWTNTFFFEKSVSDFMPK